MCSCLPDSAPSGSVSYVSSESPLFLSSSDLVLLRDSIRFIHNLGLRDYTDVLTLLDVLLDGPGDTDPSFL